jgi:hypothetical protein
MFDVTVSLVDNRERERERESSEIQLSCSAALTETRRLKIADGGNGYFRTTIVQQSYNGRAIAVQGPYETLFGLFYLL